MQYKSKLISTVSLIPDEPFNGDTDLVSDFLYRFFIRKIITTKLFSSRKVFDKYEAIAAYFMGDSEILNIYKISPKEALRQKDDEHTQLLIDINELIIILEDGCDWNECDEVCYKFEQILEQYSPIESGEYEFSIKNYIYTELRERKRIIDGVEPVIIKRPTEIIPFPRNKK